MGVHIYPGAWRLIEPHLLLPFLHWLPKTILRQGYIRLAVSLGLIPVWIETKGRSPAEQARVYYNYSIQNTYYRNPREVKETLGTFGWDVHFEPGGFPSWLRGTNLLAKNAVTKRCYTFLSQRLGTTVLVMTRRK